MCRYTNYCISSPIIIVILRIASLWRYFASASDRRPIFSSFAFETRCTLLIIFHSRIATRECKLQTLARSMIGTRIEGDCRGQSYCPSKWTISIVILRKCKGTRHCGVCAMDMRFAQMQENIRRSKYRISISWFWQIVKFLTFDYHRCYACIFTYHYILYCIIVINLRVFSPSAPFLII